MSISWEFSSDAETILKSILEAAVPDENSKKWLSKFCPKNLNENVLKTDESRVAVEEESMIIDIEPQELDNGVNKLLDNESVLDDFELEGDLKFDVLVTECLKNNNLLTLIAVKSSRNVIEKLCHHFYSTPDINSEFKNLFYTKFLPTLLKHDSSLFSIDLLIKANSIHIEHFKNLLHIILKDLDIPFKILHDFVMVLNEKQKNMFLLSIAEINLDCKSFDYHILTICAAYKNCTKDVLIQNFILNSLLLNYRSCTKFRDFGRLLLMFLQMQKLHNFVIELGEIEKVLDYHQSPFKKPCLNLYKEILDK